MDVVVTGIGLISALGDLETSWSRLLLGNSAIYMSQPFPELRPRPLALIGNRPLELSWLTEQVVYQALKDAGLTPPLADCGVVVGSSRAHQAQWEQLARSKINPLTLFVDTLPHTPALRTARQIGSTGPVLAPMAACATALWSLAHGYWWIKQGQCQRVLAGAVEAPITPLTLAGFAQMGALANTGCFPFDRAREGLALAEAGGVFVLESELAAQERGAKIYGQILGVGLTSDASYANAPDWQGRSGEVALKDCLHRSRALVEEIGYIHAHGTGTTLNDKGEAELIEQMFPLGVPVSSTKGATGHSLGASGIVAAAFCLKALQTGILPPCVGLRETLFNLDFVQEARKRPVDKVLCFNFGFGGQNAVISFGKYGFKNNH